MCPHGSHRNSQDKVLASKGQVARRAIGQFGIGSCPVFLVVAGEGRLG